MEASVVWPSHTGSVHRGGEAWEQRLRGFLWAPVLPVGGERSGLGSGSIPSGHTLYMNFEVSVSGRVSASCSRLLGNSLVLHSAEVSTLGWYNALEKLRSKEGPKSEKTGPPLGTKRQTTQFVLTCRIAPGI